MTPRLSRYVARTVIAGTLLVLAVIVSIDALFTFIGEIASTGEGEYTITLALLYILLTLPARIYELFPAAVAIGGVVGLGGLAAHSELIVMRAAGISTRRIVAMVMQAGFVFVVAIVLLGEFVAPPSQQYAERMRASAITGQSDMGPGGFWVRDRQRFIEIGRVLPGYVLRDVRVYTFDQRQLDQALHAERAHYDGNVWQLLDVRTTRLRNGELQTERLQELRWQRLVPRDLFQVLTVSPESLPAWRLWEYVDYLRRNQLEATRFALALWQKIATPISTLVMLLLALPIVFGSVRSTGAGQRVFLGSIIGVSYLLLAELFAHVGIVYGLAAPLAVLAPPALFVLAGCVLLRRAL